MNKGVMLELQNIRKAVEKIDPANQIDYEEVFNSIEAGNIKIGETDKMDYYTKRRLVLRIVNYSIEEACKMIIDKLDSVGLTMLNGLKTSVYNLCVNNTSFIDEHYKDDTDDFEKDQKRWHKLLTLQIDKLIEYIERQ